MVTGRFVEVTSSRFSFEALRRSSLGVRVTTSVTTWRGVPAPADNADRP